MSRTGARLVVETLAAAGVKHLFTLSGNQILAIYDATIESGITDVGYYRYRHRRHYYYPRYWGGPAYPYYRYSAPGFYDQGYAYRGNINGCSIDLGYGRYESCDKGPR